MKKRKRVIIPVEKRTPLPKRSRMPPKPYYQPMSKYEFIRAQEHFDLPNMHFSELIGVGWRQGQRYRDGASVIPDAVAKLIRTAINNDLALEDIG